jgi:ABC-type multidrug transport system fused ATPase/permease subunit
VTHRLTRFRELSRYLRVSRGAITLLVVTSIAAGFAEAVVLALVAYIAEAVSEGTQSVHLELTGVTVGRAGIPVLLGIGFALVAARLALQEVGAYLPARVGATLQFSLREELWASYLAASWEVQADDREGSLQEALTGQVQQATDGVLMAANGVAAAVTFAALVASSLLLNAAIAGLTILAAAVLFVGLRPLTGLARRFSQQMSADTVDYAAGVSEGVRLAQEIKVFGAADAQRERSLDRLGRVRYAYFRGQLLGRNIIPLYQAAALVIILGGLTGLYLSGTARIAALGAVVLVLIRALNYSQTVQASYHRVNEALPFVDAVKAAQDRYGAALEGDGDLPLPTVATIEVRDLSFAYVPGRDVLRRVSFAIGRGESVGIIGPSGAGKSTLMELVLRLRTATTGSILVNDRPVERFSRVDWARRVAYVPQESRLLAASVYDNIAFFRPWIGEQAVQSAARRANIHDEIASMPSGYGTEIGPRADTVSGGQRQRICLARALAGEPDVLLLDEPTSALDLQSETFVQQSLRDVHGAVTMLIVAHRLSTLGVCDRIMVVEDGQLEAFGRADELIASNAFFRDAVSLSQSGQAGLLP